MSDSCDSFSNLPPNDLIDCSTVKVMMRAREMNRKWHSWVLDIDFILKFLLVTPKIDYGLEWFEVEVSRSFSITVAYGSTV